MHEHGKSVAIAHCDSRRLPRAHECRRVEEHGGHVALTVRQELQTYQLSHSLKILECVELLSLANCIVTQKGFASGKFMFVRDKFSPTWVCALNLSITRTVHQHAND
jgi:hypothetical protein